MNLVFRAKAISWLLVAMLVSLLPIPALAANKPVKNVIVVMVDGTGSTHTTVSRWYNDAKPLTVEGIVTGSIRTYSAESLISDSAPAATAFATGYKSNSKFVGVLPGKTTMPAVLAISDELKYKPVATVLEGAKLQGKAVGIIATANIQHASPAGYSAHTSNRGDYNDIAEQQVYQDIDVVFGGGKQYLTPKDSGGKRTDGENLIEVLKAKGYQFIENRAQLANVKGGKVWGIFAEDDMAYDFDRRQLRPSEPSLAEMTKKAIEVLSQNKKGFFLFVEASKVDWASHANDPVGVISDILAWDEAVKAALDFAKADGQTLVLAFADHSNGGMSIGNKSTDNFYDTLPYAKLVEPLKKAVLTGEGIEKTIGEDRTESNIRLTMKNYFGVEDLSADEVAAIQNAQKGKMNYVVGPIISKRSVIGWTTNGHTGEDLFLYAYGPVKISGTIENTQLAVIQAETLGFDLAAADKKLFVETDKAFVAIGAKAKLDKSDPANLVLVIEKDGKKAELPISKDILKIGEKLYELPGLTVLAATTGKVYVSQQAIDIIATNL